MDMKYIVCLTIILATLHGKNYNTPYLDFLKDTSYAWFQAWHRSLVAKNTKHSPHNLSIVLYIYVK